MRDDLAERRAAKRRQDAIHNFSNGSLGEADLRDFLRRQSVSQSEIDTIVLANQRPAGVA